MNEQDSAEEPTSPMTRTKTTFVDDPDATSESTSQPAVKI